MAILLVFGHLILAESAVAVDSRAGESTPSALSTRWSRPLRLYDRLAKIS
jgi:hypothetical protein